jgi:NAD(P)-dependent dehydrogenase (short-subunit alcohol dehydrogenase family)
LALHWRGIMRRVARRSASSRAGNRNLTHLQRSSSWYRAYLCRRCPRRGSAGPRAAADFIARFGVPDIVIASAGISHGTLTDKAEDLPVFRAVFDTNVLGMVHAFHPFVRGDARSRRGALVGIASVAGFRGLPGSGAYSASKAAAITYLESLRLELADSGVAVITICPGFIATPMTERNPYRMPFPDRVRQGGAPHCPCDRAQETRLCVAVADGDCRWRAATHAALVVRHWFCPGAAQAAADQLSSPDTAQSRDRPVKHVRRHANHGNTLSTTDRARTDWAGIVHPPAGTEPRIACVVPSLTELLFALDLGPRVVARTGFCVHPRDSVKRRTEDRRHQGTSISMRYVRNGRRTWSSTSMRIGWRP